MRLTASCLPNKIFFNFVKKFSIKNLTTEISHVKNVDGHGFKATIQKGSIYDLELSNSTINLIRKKNDTKVNSLLKTKGKLNFSQIKKISSLFGLNTSNFKDMNGNVNLKIPSGTQPNTTLSLENKGVPRLGNPVARGNHEVLVKVKLPTRITDAERELLEGLASQYSDKNINSNSGLFSKLFGKES